VEFLIHSIILLFQGLWTTGADNVTQIPSCCQRHRRNTESETLCRSTPIWCWSRMNFFAEQKQLL